MEVPQLVELQSVNVNVLLVLQDQTVKEVSFKKLYYSGIHTPYPSAFLPTWHNFRDID